MYFDVHLIALMNPSEPVSETETERERVLKHPSQDQPKRAETNSGFAR